MKLRVSDASHVLGILDLVKSDFFGADILYMSNATIGEDMPFDLQLTKDFLEFRENMLRDCWSACELQIIDVFAKKCKQRSLVMPET